MGLDFTKTTSELSRKTGLSPSYISRLRRKHAPETLGKGRTGRPSKVDWSKVNWSQPNWAIAKSLGVHEDTVRKNRP